ncbi:ketoacyl-ACP synthase III family protein [Kitasatospora sp. NPDC056076]|uniref:ketoacyl-ACP synthase III family protein n=1 Tax=Kitasatospora sp. NPDC056076 TaxID=3345703 RepID=UPI0035D5C881
MTDELYIAGCASWLPRAVPVAEAVASGAFPESEAVRTGMQAVRIAAEEDSAADMAARAARLALRRAGRDPSEIGLLLHATLYDQGHDLWGAASYVQALALGTGPAACPAVEIRQVSNGGMAAVELAGAFLRAGGSSATALLTAGDVFCPPAFDRWRADPGTVYADGGAALVLARSTGFARLRALVTVSDPGLERMHRGDHAFRPPADGGVRKVDLEECKEQYLARHGMRATVERAARGQRSAVEGVLAEAKVELADIARFVLPHLGRRRLESAFFRPFGIAPERTTWPWSRGVGHLGAGDQFAGLARLVEDRQVGPGDLVLLLGVGAGFTWSAAVVEVLEVPDWSAPER